MSESLDDLKRPFIDLFELQRKQLEKSLKFYEQLKKSISEDEQWKIVEESPVFDALIGVSAVTKTDLPNDIIETIIETVDEYIEAVDSFSADQFAAFLLGLGLRWIPFQYWGMKNLGEYYAKLQKELAFNEKLEAEIPEDEIWKLEKTDPFNISRLVPANRVLTSKLIAQSLLYIENILKVLSDRPF